ncbi:MAG: NADH-quinone oxidoreductase subunit L [Thermodesulfobacteriota bacterium]
MKTYLFLLLLFPFAGGLILAAIGRYLPRRFAEWIACASVLGSLLMAALAFGGTGGKRYLLTLFDWIQVGDFSASMTVYYDSLAAIMALMVTFVSSLIHLYSVSFMRDDQDYVRYFCYMNLFVFSMLVITLADNLVFLYLGWEGVGFCSYILIGFWYSDVVNATAGRKAFILTRIGDVAFGIAIALFFLTLDQFSIFSINSKAASLGGGMATLLGLLLFWGAVGKSAQLPLIVWLPNAMAGPTPVSALIHAATMVTAGAYLLMRLFPVIALSSIAMVTIATVAAFTGLFAALAALGQKDIKRILAYSTISQVSYMFLGVGAGDVTGSMYHLLSHAFFKALLFLGAGCVIQALHEEHDIFKMGNLRKRLPVVFWLYLVGSVSLAAIPPFGGFFSKDRILLSTFSHPEPIYKFLGLIAEIGVLITVLYTFRMFFVAFLEKPSLQSDFKKEDLKIPKFMAWINAPLAILAILAGALNFPEAFGGKAWLAGYLGSVPGGLPSFPASVSLERSMEIGSGLLNIALLIVAYFLYRPEGRFLEQPTPVVLRRGLEEFLLSGFYLDRLYQIAFVRPYQVIARILWLNVDERVVDDRFDATANIFRFFSLGLQLWTTGRLSTYLKMLLLGFTAILSALALGWYYLR